MSRAHFFAFTLIEALIREDVDLLDVTVSEINLDENDLKTGVNCALAAMLSSGLIAAHGTVGALAQLDRSRAEFADRDSA
jgi:hypothetical protein